jgi:catechol 2,3-dioxygenase-like lactoylglutathione lyase family enzyme
MAGNGIGPAKGLEVTIEVKQQIEPMLHFYKDLLGFEDFGKGHFESTATHKATSVKVWGLAWGDSVLKLVVTEGVEWPHQNPQLSAKERGYGFTHITMKVDDGPALIERCRAAGVEIVVPWVPLPEGLGDGDPANGIAYLRDPEGNLVEPQHGWPFS